MINKVNEILESAIQSVDKAKDKNELYNVNSTYLGKNGSLSEILHNLKNLAQEERKKIGQVVNEVRQKIDSYFREKLAKFEKKELDQKLKNEKVDVTIPVKPLKVGNVHPVSAVQNDLLDFFVSKGFTVTSCVDVETDHYCFEALNIPKDHPARDAQDSFYIDPETVLRVHTSASQIKTMEKQKPPIKMVSTGMVYRVDEIDATHSPIFHQFEILVVDENVTMCDLKAMLEDIAKFLLGEHTQIRLRPSFFPFTEPSAEVDVTCPSCKGKGCGMCKQSGFIEVLGCGMVHPKVLENCGINSEKYSGYAIGLGLDRLVMLRYGLNNIRDIYENNVSLLKQVK